MSSKCRSAQALSYRSIGNALHATVLASIAFYGYAIFQLLRAFRSDKLSSPSDNYDKIKILQVDSHWLENGFCMPHAEIPHFTTHERCGYFMIAMSILGFILLYSLPDKTNTMANAKERVQWALLGAIGHACGHIILAVTKRNGLLPSGDVSAMDEFLSDDCSWVTFAKHLPGYFLFWIPLVKTYMSNVSQRHIMGFAFLIMFGAMQLPLKFGFSYTLIVLFAGQSLDQLLFLKRDQKDNLEYLLWPLVTLLPNFYISVMESVWCSRSVQGSGGEDLLLLAGLFERHGHLIFDGYMAISYSIYYLICWCGNNNNMKVKVKKF